AVESNGKSAFSDERCSGLNGLQGNFTKENGRELIRNRQRKHRSPDERAMLSPPGHEEEKHPSNRGSRGHRQRLRGRADGGGREEQTRDAQNQANDDRRDDRGRKWTNEIARALLKDTRHSIRSGQHRRGNE